MVLNGNFVIYLHDIFQECNPGIERELPAFLCIFPYFLTDLVKIYYRRSLRNVIEQL